MLLHARCVVTEQYIARSERRITYENSNAYEHAVANEDAITNKHSVAYEYADAVAYKYAVTYEHTATKGNAIRGSSICHQCGPAAHCRAVACQYAIVDRDAGGK